MLYNRLMFEKSVTLIKFRRINSITQLLLAKQYFNKIKFTNCLKPEMRRRWASVVKRSYSFLSFVILLCCTMHSNVQGKNNMLTIELLLQLCFQMLEKLYLIELGKRFSEELFIKQKQLQENMFFQSFSLTNYCNQTKEI